MTPHPNRTRDNLVEVVATTAFHASALWNLCFVLGAEPRTGEAVHISFAVAVCVAIVLAVAACGMNVAACARGWRSARGGWRWLIGAASLLCGYLGLYTGLIVGLVIWVAGR